MKQIKIKQKEQNGGFLPMLLGTVTTSMLGSILTGGAVIRADESTIKAGKNILIPPHYLTNLKNKIFIKMNLNLIQETIY